MSVPLDVVSNMLEWQFSTTVIALLVVGGLLVSVGSGITVVSYVKRRELKETVTEQYKKIRDGYVNPPRCTAAAMELGIKIQTPWKDYFTRDEKPFITESPVP